MMEENGMEKRPEEVKPQENDNTGSAPEIPPVPHKPLKKKKSKLPAILIAIAVIMMLLSAASVIGHAFNTMFGTGAGTGADEEVHFSSPYIAELKVDGVIQGGSDSVFSENGYNHSWTLKKIEELADDGNNKGLILFVNTPGGGVYESDELYFAIKDYKEKTGRPVYSYMASQATSGGYYISAPCDRIIANRNCWTGSIGVTIGTIYDISGLLKKYGVKSVTITSGDNKAMGNQVEPMTDEQRKIFQGLVDEAYDQFVGIVSEGRKMDEKKVREIADGRVYTAKQAKANGLIDDIGTIDDAVADMQRRFELTNAQPREIKYTDNRPLFYRLLDSVSELNREKSLTELDKIKALMDENGKFTVTYLSEVEK